MSKTPNGPSKANVKALRAYNAMFLYEAEPNNCNVRTGEWVSLAKKLYAMGYYLLASKCDSRTMHGREAI